ncbi:SURF1 family protein [Microbulbifer sp. PSTR4-B]|uniref:SURF1 family protein n=1 Tax=Microbulbifer sp. PSTR4-B TaxID=3243396 RepID=UPI004039A919
MTVEIPSVSSDNTSVSLIRNWSITLFSFGFIPVFVLLGFWQLGRADDKRIIDLEINSRLSSQPENLHLVTNLKRFLPVKLDGNYSDEYFLLDNRTRTGKVGYEVLQVFISGEQRWLINRGWIPFSASRDVMPEVNYPKDKIKINGFLYPVENLKSIENKEKIINRRIQIVNKEIVQNMTLSNNNWIVRLSADSESAFITDWQLVNSSVDRHIAYAIQWFAMATALFFLWLFTATNFIKVNKINN